MIFWQARMPRILAGLCSGANALHSSISLITFSSINTDEENFSPPCTTRWPMASISSRDFSIPCSGATKASRTVFIATEWSGMSTDFSSFSPFTLIEKIPSSPILSHWPEALTSSDSESISWYFKDELPQFTTRIFITYFLHYILLWKHKAPSPAYGVYSYNNAQRQLILDQKPLCAIMLVLSAHLTVTGPVLLSEQ